MIQRTNRLETETAELRADNADSHCAYVTQISMMREMFEFVNVDKITLAQIRLFVKQNALRVFVKNVKFY